MRREDREITDIREIAEIIKKCDVCRIALNDGSFPYIVPLNFGIECDGAGITLYFHGADAGRKMELIRADGRAAFEMDCSHRLILGEPCCGSTMEYESVCGTGIIEILGADEKIHALAALMKQYGGQKEYVFSQSSVKNVAVFRLSAKSVTAKRLKRESA